MSSLVDRRVTLRDVLAWVAARRVAAPPEIAGFLCLELATCALEQPGKLSAEAISLHEDGTLSLTPQASGTAPVRFIRESLAQLLAQCASKPPALLAAAQSDEDDLPRLQQQLQAALVPLNRPASQRALARLQQQVLRLCEQEGAPVSDDAEKIAKTGNNTHSDDAKKIAKTGNNTHSDDAEKIAKTGNNPHSDDDAAERAQHRALRDELKQLAGLDPTPPVLSASLELSLESTKQPASLELSLESTKQPASLELSLESTKQPASLELSLESTTIIPGEVRGEKAREVLSPHERSTLRPDEIEAQELERAHAARQAHAAREPLPTPSELRALGAPQQRAKLARTLSFAVLGLFLLAFVLVYLLRPEWMLGHPVEPAPQPAPTAKPPAPPPRCALKLTDVRPGAEILLLQGTAPLDVTPMPAGARIEFVATLDGYAPKRAVVPAQARWDRDGSGRPRYELALELAPLRKTASRWPLAEAGTTVGGEGEPGVVRVVSSPRDAEIWLLFGAGPEAALEPIPCTSHEILIAPTDRKGQSAPQRISVSEQQFVLDAATHTARAEISLTAPQAPRSATP